MQQLVEEGGFQLFSRFVFLENRLKYFQKDLPEERVLELLNKFGIDFAYLQLIAKKNGIENPLDKEVVEAYWIGNKLLENVSGTDIREVFLYNFLENGILPQEIALSLAKSIPEEATIHHSFHVYCLSFLLADEPLILRELDKFRVAWGLLKEKTQGTALVQFQPVCFEENKLAFGKTIQREINYIPELFQLTKPNASVAFRLNDLCAELTEKQTLNLMHYTQKTIDLINSIW